ncbi:MAG TPA: CHAD domain-containing protein [Nitrososphaerales archaeon]|nr:CHAD domain-containing protein [Nitrososphaerales archaeon]
MKATRIASTQLAKAFDRNVATVETRLQDFLKSGDSATTAALRKAVGRLRTTCSVLPKSARRPRRVRRYLSASRKLSKALGKVRDIDTVAAWTMQVSQGKDQRSFISDLERIRAANLRASFLKAKELSKTEVPTLDLPDLSDSGSRAVKVERRLAKRVDKEFEEFLSTQEVEVMHALRKDSKRLRHLLELTERGEGTPLLGRLRSIQDDLGAIRDHDLVIDYLRSRVRLTSTRSLVREEIAKRHARLEDFVTKNRGQGHLVPVAAK